MILKSTVKMIVDLLMTVVMFVLIITHHLLNIGWYKRVAYKIAIFITIIDISLSVIMIISLISGIIMYREIFALIDISASISLAHDLYMLSAYYVFTLLSMHIGLHFDMIKAISKKTLKIKGLSRELIVFLHMSAIAFVIYAFIKNDILSYMFLRTHFVFFDLEQPLIFFFGGKVDIDTKDS